ncbi:cationic amino acid transporter 4-like [Plakobranchus ocellatus]|uniref:Cationic amino acid transporter 4-like n=1 Tax=Plakobranchus ocellatus TaxID=259542 RepID=A0AAV4B8T4_9GAST|nr:cationic amino acid transporter 4-like [Plakobranchus ocellatus]
MGTPFAETPDILAFVLQIGVTLFASFNVMCTSAINTALGIINISVLIFVFVSGLVVGDPQALVNSDAGGFFPFGWEGVAKASFVILFALSEFEMVSMSAEETKDPAKSIPRAMALTLLLVAFIYVGTTVGLFFLVPYWAIDTRAPLPSAFAHRGLAWGQFVVTVAPMVALSNLQLVAVYAVSRCIYRMSKDGLLFSFFLTVNKSTGIPLRAVLFTGLGSSLLALVFDISYQVKMVVVFKVVSYIAVASALIKLKITRSQWASNSTPSLTFFEDEDIEPISHATERDIVSQENRNTNRLSEKNGDLKQRVSEIDADNSNLWDKTLSAFGKVSTSKIKNNSYAKNTTQSAKPFYFMTNGGCGDIDRYFKSTDTGKKLPKSDMEMCDSNKSNQARPYGASACKNYGTLKTDSEIERQNESSLPDASGQHGSTVSSAQTHGSTVIEAVKTDESTVAGAVQTHGPTVIESLQAHRTFPNLQTYGTKNINTVQGTAPRIATCLFPIVPGLISINVLIVLHLVACVALAAQVFYCQGYLMMLQPGAVLACFLLCSLVLTFSFFLWALCASGPTGDATEAIFQTPLMPLVPTLSILLSATMMFLGVEKEEIFEVLVVVVLAIMTYVLLTTCRYHRGRQKEGEKRTLVSINGASKQDIIQNGNTH